jgi:glycogen phosphorylase
MNEGHAALLTLALLESQLGGGPLGAATETDIEQVRRKCVFTTHTPVPAGHDRFSTEQTIRILGGDRTARLEKLGCFRDGMLNMTLLALRFSRYANGVAMQHAKVSRPCSRSFPSTPSPTACTRPPGFPSRCSRCWMRIPGVAARQSVSAQRDRPAGEGDSRGARARQGGTAGRGGRTRTGLVLNPQGADAGLCAARGHLQARHAAVHRSRAAGGDCQRRPAACRFSTPARRIRRTSPARR